MIVVEPTSLALQAAYAILFVLVETFLGYELKQAWQKMKEHDNET